MGEREHRKKRLTPEQKWQIFLEASRKNTTDDLRIVQSFSRPKTPTDNAACESWVATLKCERLYEANTADMAPWEVESLIDRFIGSLQQREAAPGHQLRHSGRAA